MELILHLGLVLLSIAGLVSPIDIDNIFTLEPGDNSGGCGNQLNTLDTYLQDVIDSTTAAIDAIDTITDTNVMVTEDVERVRQAVLTWFGITPTNQGRFLNKVKQNIVEVQSFFIGENGNVPLAQTFLYCDSTWLAEREPTDPAQDYLGHDIEVNDNPVLINQVPAFRAALNAGDDAWFSGDLTQVNGYYFTGPEDGGNYCGQAGNLGLTSSVRTLTTNAAGNAVPYRWRNNNVILCPDSFTAQNGPASYQAGDAAIAAGTSLDPVVPQSSTLLHEAFHLTLGTDGMNQGSTGGNQEYYGMANCAQLAMINAGSARRNPENYVYFISAMYYLFGDTLGSDDGDSPITVYWDFTNGPDMARGPIAR